MNSYKQVLRVSALAGKRILITRPRLQAAELGERLAALGAIPIYLPTIEIAPLLDYAKLDEALKNLARYQWIIFTSVNGVAAVWERMSGLRAGTSPAPTTKVAAIGPATAKALADQGVEAAFVPEEYIAEAILDGLGEVRGQRILLPRADRAREVLAVELRRQGAVVDEIAAYRTVPAVPDPEGLAELQHGVDAITFTSASTVRSFVEQLGRPPDEALVACIGPITAQAAEAVGLKVAIVAQEYTMAGLVTALENYFTRESV